MTLQTNSNKYRFNTFLTPFHRIRAISNLIGSRKQQSIIYIYIYIYIYIHQDYFASSNGIQLIGNNLPAEQRGRPHGPQYHPGVDVQLPAQIPSTPPAPTYPSSR